jgi:heparosan-N-sulfate-glucuronate 5-epimerase
MKVLLSFVLAWAMQFGSKTTALPEYESFQHIDAEGYTNQFGRKFDKDGVLMQGKEYHPLTICVYGTLCYDNFRATGDSMYYYRVLNQYKFFGEPNNIVYSDSNQCAGLPYRFDAQGMKAPWYSAMTQGIAASYLLRYYELTGDKNAMELSRKIIRFMLKPENKGGTLGRSLEGGPWLEEYPGNMKSKSVLNGFINAYLGLYEYCIYFPKDEHAALMRDSCYSEFITNVHKYDTPNWTAYSRHGTPISNSYLRYQLEQMDHLYSLHRDERLRNQMKLWAKLAFNRPDQEIKFLKLTYYQFGIALSGNPATDSCVYNNYPAFAKGLVAAAPSSVSKNTAVYKFTDLKYYGEIKVLASELTANDINVHATQGGVNVFIKCTFTGKRVTIEASTPFDELEVTYPKQKSRKACPVTVSAYDHKKCAEAMFGFYELKKQEPLRKGNSYKFTFQGHNLINARVFYRFAPSGVRPETKPYNVAQSFDLADEYFTAPGDGTYQFFISYDLVVPESGLSKLTLVSL